MEFTYEQPMEGQEIYIKHLAPPDKLCRLKERTVSSVAAIVGEYGKRKAVGLMMLQLDADRQLELMWLYVEREYRNKGIAEVFLKLLYDAGRKMHANWISTEFCDYMMGEYSAKEMMEYLKKHGILTTSEEDGPWVIPGDVFVEEPFVAEAIESVRKNRPGLIFFHQLTAREISSCMTKLAPHDVGAGNFTDTSISCAVRNGEEWKGVLIVDKYGDVYEPRVFAAADEKTAMMLFGGMIGRLGGKIKSLEFLRVNEEPRVFAKWMEKVFTGFSRLECYIGGGGI